MRVQCPLCSQRIEGASEDELTNHLQEHMIVEHGLDDICVTKSYEGSEISVERRTAGCDPDATGEEKEVYMGREVSLSDLPYEVKAETAAHAGSSRPPGEDIMESVRCPVCGIRVTGHAEDDLSFNLEAHTTRDHGMRKKAREMLGVEKD